MHKQMASAGLSQSSFADSTAFFIGSHWSLARGQSAPPTKPILLAFGKQVAALLAEQPDIVRMSNAAKQRQSESGLLLLAIMLRSVKDARGNPEEQRVIAASAAQTLKSIGFDPATFDLTPQGLVPVR